MSSKGAADMLPGIADLPELEPGSERALDTAPDSTKPRNGRGYVLDLDGGYRFAQVYCPLAGDRFSPQ